MRRYAMGRFEVPLLAGALSACLSGCLSMSYTDANNVRHVIGFVDLAITPQGSSAPAATVSTVRALGLHIYSHGDNGSGVMLGFSKDTYIVAPENSCVDLAAPGACARPPKLSMTEKMGGMR